MNTRKSITMMVIIVVCIVGFLFVFTGTSNAGWIFYHKSAYKGRVINAETGDPVEGAVVKVEYWKDGLIGIPSGPESYIIKIKETLTDEKGEFRIPSYFTLTGPLSIEANPKMVIYKPGYRIFERGENGVNAAYIFSKKPGTTETIYKERLIGRKVFFDKLAITFGTAKLKPANTWDERSRSIPSVSGSVKEKDYPILNGMCNKELEWLRKNKRWRRQKNEK